MVVNKKHNVDSNVSAWDLVHSYFPQWEIAVKEAGARGVMCSYKGPIHRLFFTDFYRFFGLSWETSTFKNHHPEDSRRPGSWKNRVLLEEHHVFNAAIPPEVEREQTYGGSKVFVQLLAGKLAQLLTGKLARPMAAPVGPRAQHLPGQLRRTGGRIARAAARSTAARAV